MKATIIKSFATFILGGDVFARIKAMVERLEDTNLPGEQKRAALIGQAKIIGLAIAGWALNLGIELAVAYLRAQARQV